MSPVGGYAHFAPVYDTRANSSRVKKAMQKARCITCIFVNKCGRSNQISNAAVEAVIEHPYAIVNAEVMLSDIDPADNDMKKKYAMPTHHARKSRFRNGSIS